MTSCAVLLPLGLLICVPAFAAPAKGARTFYVSPFGRDDWSGKLPAPNRAQKDGPFLTLPRALDAVRQARASGNTATVTVLLREGTYTVTRPLAITPAHSGTADGRTVIAAYPDEHPLISGGRRTTGWQPGEGGVWQTEIPEVKSGRWNFRQLWVNGERRSRPRLPKEGTYALAGGADPDKSAFRYAPDDLRADWANRDDIEVVVLQFWTEARLHIARLDEANHVVTFTGGSWRPLTWSMGYSVENVHEALTEPGNWYLDRPSGILRYRPLPGEDMTQAEVIAPVAEQLLLMQANPDSGAFVEHVILRGLRFAHCAWPLPKEGLAYPQAELAVSAAIWARGAHDCTIEDCEIAHCDSWAIELEQGCQDCRLTHNTLRDLGAGGMKIGEVENRENDAAETCRTTISDNTLTDGAQTYFGGPGIWIGNSSYNTVSHNEISGSWQWAVSVGWRWAYFPPQRARSNVVEFNHVHRLGGALGSHSSIYTLGIEPGTVIRNNVIHHCAGYGIGLDQSSTGIVVENNLVYRNAHGLHFNWDCLGNIVRNNLFAFNGEAQWTRYGDAPQAEDMNTNVIERNICVWDEGRLWVEPKWPNYRMAIDYNLYYDFSGEPVTFLGFPLDEWRTKGPWLDKHSLIADPLFVDADHDDFRLRDDSPAIGLGFRPFDTAAVGPRP
jgi:parallel beta-helix repeat protein